MARPLLNIIVLMLNAALVFVDSVALNLFNFAGEMMSNGLLNAGVEIPKVSEFTMSCTPFLMGEGMIRIYAPGVLFLAILVLGLLKPGDRMGRAALATTILTAILSIFVIVFFLGYILPLYDVTMLAS